MVAKCPEKRLQRRGIHSPRDHPSTMMTLDEDSGSFLLPKTYTTRHGRLVLFAEDPLAEDVKSARQMAAAAHDAYVDKLLQDTFNGNLLYLAASILVFGDEVRVL